MLRFISKNRELKLYHNPQHLRGTTFYIKYKNTDESEGFTNFHYHAFTTDLPSCINIQILKGSITVTQINKHKYKIANKTINHIQPYKGLQTTK